MCRRNDNWRQPVVIFCECSRVRGERDENHHHHHHHQCNHGHRDHDVRGDRNSRCHCGCNRRNDVRGDREKRRHHHRDEVRGCRDERRNRCGFCGWWF